MHTNSSSREQKLFRITQLYYMHNTLETITFSRSSSCMWVIDGFNNTIEIHILENNNFVIYVEIICQIL